MNKLKREYQFFKQQTPNVRVLLMTNLLYAFVLPVVEIFVGAYVMRHTSEPVSVAFYQLFMYIGIIATSFVNGFLLRHVSVKVLYAGGILVSGLSMFAMMLVKSLGFVELGIAGFVLGAVVDKEHPALGADFSGVHEGSQLVPQPPGGLGKDFLLVEAGDDDVKGVAAHGRDLQKLWAFSSGI